MVKFIISVPKEWGDLEKDDLKSRLEKYPVFHKDDQVYITNKYTIHEVSTETFDMLSEIKNKLDANKTESGFHPDRYDFK